MASFSLAGAVSMLQSIYTVPYKSEVGVAEAVEVPVPDEVAQLRLLDRIAAYEDAFRVDTDIARTPEQWLRAFLEGAPRWFQVPWIGVAVTVLGAKVGPMRGPGHVLGWRVLHDRPDLFAVGLDSIGGLRARLVALTPPGQALIATQISLDTAYARTLWPPIRHGHRHFAPYLLERAASEPVMATR
jgi:hypothetical protein